MINGIDEMPASTVPQRNGFRGKLWLLASFIVLRDCHAAGGKASLLDSYARHRGLRLRSISARLISRLRPASS